VKPRRFCLSLTVYFLFVACSSSAATAEDEHNPHRVFIRNDAGLVNLREHGLKGDGEAHLRHTDPRLTDVTCFYKSLYVQPHAEELKKVMAIPTTAISGAGNEQEIRGSTGLLGSSAGTDGGAKPDGSDGVVAVPEVCSDARFVTKRHDPASCDTGSFEKRAKGFEPSTFTLAT
jgi:hypothetical protein